jgi:hypothetical protein
VDKHKLKTLSFIKLNDVEMKCRVQLYFHAFIILTLDAGVQPVPSYGCFMHFSLDWRPINKSTQNVPLKHIALKSPLVLASAVAAARRFKPQKTPIIDIKKKNKKKKKKRIIGRKRNRKKNEEKKKKKKKEEERRRKKNNNKKKE